MGLNEPKKTQVQLDVNGVIQKAEKYENELNQLKTRLLIREYVPKYKGNKKSSRRPFRRFPQRRAAHLQRDLRRRQEELPLSRKEHAHGGKDSQLHCGKVKKGLKTLSHTGI